MASCGIYAERELTLVSAFKAVSQSSRQDSISATAKVKSFLPAGMYINRGTELLSKSGLRVSETYDRVNWSFDNIDRFFAASREFPIISLVFFSEEWRVLIGVRDDKITEIRAWVFRHGL